MMSDDDADQQVPNQYKDALESDKPSAMRSANELRDALKAANTAMTAQAWLSPMATQFESALKSHTTTLGTAHNFVSDTFTDQIGREPYKVAKGNWKANWSRMSRMRPF